MGEYMPFTDADYALYARNKYIKDHAHFLLVESVMYDDEGGVSFADPGRIVEYTGELYDAIRAHTEQSEKELEEEKRG